MHVHEKKLQKERGQQVELHLPWHHPQRFLLVFHDIKVSYAGRKKKILSFCVSVMWTFGFVFEKNISALLQLFDRKHRLAQGFTVKRLLWF